MSELSFEDFRKNISELYSQMSNKYIESKYNLEMDSKGKELYKYYLQHKKVFFRVFNQNYLEFIKLVHLMRYYINNTNINYFYKKYVGDSSDPSYQLVYEEILNRFLINQEIPSEFSDFLSEKESSKNLLSLLDGYLDKENIDLIAELYGIKFPEDLSGFNNYFENLFGTYANFKIMNTKFSKAIRRSENNSHKNEYLLNEIQYNYEDILNRTGKETPLNFIEWNKNKLINKSIYFTAKEIFKFAFPVRIYKWQNRQVLMEEFCDQYNYIKDVRNENVDYNKLVDYYSREYEWQNPLFSKHVLNQVLGYKNQISKYYSEIDLKFVKNYKNSKERLPYRRSNNDCKSVIQWGQRKLLISEIEFLTKYGHLSKNVVYAGAAPGTHIKILSQLFPKHIFHLYDPAPFSPMIVNLSKTNKSINCYQTFFDDNVASKWKNKDILFISDIRTADVHRMDSEEIESRVSEDMNLQLNWCIIMKPLASALKMRLTWDKNAPPLKYFKGELYFQCWAPASSTELKLITTKEQIEDYIKGNYEYYDNIEYEERCFYHNKVRRVSLFYNDCADDIYKYNDKVGLDHCYDCNREVKILKKYFSSIGVDNLKIRKLVAEISASITSGNRTLLDPNVDQEERRSEIEKRQFINGVQASLGNQAKPMVFDKNIKSMYDKLMGNKKGGELLNINNNQNKFGLGYVNDFPEEKKPEIKILTRHNSKLIDNKTIFSWKNFPPSEYYLLYKPNDYYYDHNFFLKKMEKINVYNPYNTLLWNIEKNYLIELQNLGVNIIPSFVQNFLVPNIFKSEYIIIKPLIGGGSYNVFRFKTPKNNIECKEIVNFLYNKSEKMNFEFKTDMLIQPYLEHDKEYSLIYYFDGFHHAVIKQKFGIISSFKNRKVTQWDSPSEELIDLGYEILEKSKQKYLYARLDFIMFENQYYLMELEFIDPNLFYNSEKEELDDMISKYNIMIQKIKN